MNSNSTNRRAVVATRFTSVITVALATTLMFPDVGFAADPTLTAKVKANPNWTAWTAARSKCDNKEVCTSEKDAKLAFIKLKGIHRTIKSVFGAGAYEQATLDILGENYGKVPGKDSPFTFDDSEPEPVATVTETETETTTPTTTTPSSTNRGGSRRGSGGRGSSGNVTSTTTITPPATEEVPTTGNLVVTVEPATGSYSVLDSATQTAVTPQVTGPQTFVLPAGQYLVRFDSLEGFMTPEPELVTLSAGANLMVTRHHKPVEKESWFDKPSPGMVNIGIPFGILLALLSLFLQIWEMMRKRRKK